MKCGKEGNEAMVSKWDFDNDKAGACQQTKSKKHFTPAKRRKIVLYAVYFLCCVCMTTFMYSFGVHAETTNVVENINNTLRPMINSALILGTMIGGVILLVKRKFTWAFSFAGVLVVAALFINSPSVLIGWIQAFISSLFGG